MELPNAAGRRDVQRRVKGTLVQVCSTEGVFGRSKEPETDEKAERIKSPEDGLAKADKRIATLEGEVLDLDLRCAKLGARVTNKEKAIDRMYNHIEGIKKMVSAIDSQLLREGEVNRGE